MVTVTLMLATPVAAVSIREGEELVTTKPASCSAPSSRSHASGSEWPNTTTRCPSGRSTRRASWNARANDLS